MYFEKKKEREREKESGEVNGGIFQEELRYLIELKKQARTGVIVHLCNSF